VNFRPLVIYSINNVQDWLMNLFSACDQIIFCFLLIFFYLKSKYKSIIFDPSSTSIVLFFASGELMFEFVQDDKDTDNVLQTIMNYQG